MTYTKSKKLVCDWTDKKKYLIHYRMLKFYARHGMIVEELLNFFHLNRVSGWKNIIVLLHKNETELKMILRKPSSNFSLMLLLVNF